MVKLFIYLIIVQLTLSCSNVIIEQKMNNVRMIASGDTSCIDIFHQIIRSKDSSSENYEKLRSKLIDKHPSLKFVLEDPDKFSKEIKLRFSKQKEITPNSPHSFDYSEVGIPAVELMIKGIELNSKEIEILFNQRKFKINQFEKDLLLEYLNEIKIKMLGHQQSRSVTYIELLKLSNYYSRAITLHQTLGHTKLQKVQLRFDRYLEGYAPMSIHEEIELFRKDNYFVFPEDRQSGIRGYREAQPHFVDAILNKSDIDAIIVPTGEEIDRDFLYYLFSRDSIYVGGLSQKAIQADGFYRPSGDFWYHDLRHESGKFHRKAEYLNENNISKKNIPMLNRQLDLWMMDLKNATMKIKDQNQREAVELMAFNFHHDSGYVMAPSVYFKKFSILRTVLFYISLKVGKEKTFSQPFKNFIFAKKFLNDFWSSKIEEEKNAIAKINQLNKDSS